VHNVRCLWRTSVSSRALRPRRALRPCRALGRRVGGHGHGDEERPEAPRALAGVLGEVVKVDGDGRREHRHALAEPQRARDRLHAAGLA